MTLPTVEEITKIFELNNTENSVLNTLNMWKKYIEDIDLQITPIIVCIHFEEKQQDYIFRVE